MSLYNENQRNQKLVVLKYLNKYNGRIARLDGKRGTLDDYSTLEKALKETNSRDLKEMLKKEIQKKKSKGTNESPEIEVILNQGTDFVLPVTKSDIRSMGSFAYTMYSYFQNSNKEEDRFGNYLVIKTSGRDASNLAKNISKAPGLKNVTVAGRFNFEYIRCPRGKHKGRKASNNLGRLSDRDKQSIYELREKGETDSYKIKEKLGLKCGTMQIAGIIAAYARKKT